MVPSALLLLISASLCSLGLALPIMMVKPNDHFDADKSTSSRDGLIIADQIVQANKDVPFILMEGDIKVFGSRSALNCKDCLWEKSNAGTVIVPYTISSEYSATNRDLITSALLEFTTMTCVLFQEVGEESDYLSIEGGLVGCWSYVGKTSGQQIMSLKQNSCMRYGIIQHEIVHLLGFFHEHNRSDRDSYVDINWQFISPENHGNFKKDNMNTINIPYDYASVMHYSRKTFVNTSGQMSIIPKPNPSIVIGQTTGLSNLDIKKINALYNCNLCRTKLLGVSGTFSSNDATPMNNSDNCLWLLHVPSKLILLQFSLFVCSSAKCKAKINVYDGVSKDSPLLVMVQADQLPPMLISTGKFMLLEYITDTPILSSFLASYETVTYGGTFTTDRGSIESPNYPKPYPNYVNVTYVVIAPSGNQVSLTFINFDIESSPKCTNDYVNVRDGGDLSAPLVGVYCGYTSNLVISSSGPMVVLQFFSNSKINRKGFKADYSFVPMTQEVQLSKR